MKIILSQKIKMIYNKKFYNKKIIFLNIRNYY